MLLAHVAALAIVVAAPVEPLVPTPAKPATYELDWSAPPSCPDADAVRRRIASLIREHVDGDGVMFVAGAVEETAEGFTLTLRTEFANHRSSRQIEATRCIDLGETTALVIAAALEHGLDGPAVEVPEPIVEPTPSTPPEPGPEPAASDRKGDGSITSPGVEPLPEPAPRPSRPTRSRELAGVVLRLGPRFEYGSLPGVGGGVDLAVALVWPRWRLEARGTYLWPRDADGPPDTAGRFQLGAVDAVGCGRLWAKRVEFPLCVGLEAGAIRIDSRGALPRNTLHNPWLAPLAGAGVAFSGERLGFWSMFETAITAVGTRTFIGDAVAFESFPVSLRVMAGLEIRFTIKSR